MNLEDKAREIDDLKRRFEASPLVVLADFKGITVKELDKVRRTCEKAGVHFQVVKNTLCWRAVQGTDKEKLADHFRGNIAVLFSTEDATATAKMLRDQLKDAEKLSVKCGFFDGDVLDAKQIVAVADLPSREDLLATLLRTMVTGPEQLLGVLEAPARDVLLVLHNYAAKLEADGQQA